jgi:hypothetical protein
MPSSGIQIIDNRQAGRRRKQINKKTGNQWQIS